MNIELLFSKGITLKRVMIITFITMLILLAIYYLHPANNNWFSSDDFSLGNLLQFVFIDQILIELTTTYIILYSIVKYSQILNVTSLDLNPKNIIIYYLKFFPLFLIIYFAFSPFTITIRYLYHIAINQENTSYFNSYFFLNSKLYAAYLPVVFLSGLQFLTIILITSFKGNQKTIKNTFQKNLIIKVKTDTGERLINSNDVVAICKEQNSYKVYTQKESFLTLKNLSQFEKELDFNFIRINRATIINLKFYKEYSFWKNEKYIFRMQNGQEFNITRTRLKNLKDQIKTYKDETSA